MRIALTHNLDRRGTEAEAEFDSPATIAALCDALRGLGHEVDPVEVSGSLATTLARLDASRPDLVFNMAEGHSGRSREAFFPALFEQLGLRYTGSDAYTCTVTLDKQLTKMMAARAGVPTPGWCLVERIGDEIPESLRYPLIVKPNFEGSSKGITPESVVENEAALRARLQATLPRYPEGMLVEEYIAGRDVVVPFLEAVSPETGGVLPPADYQITGLSERRWQLYDYDLKHGGNGVVAVRAPADLPEGLQQALMRHSRRLFRALGVRDLGRVDFRIDPEGRPWLLEVNALPSLEPGAGIYHSAALVGLGDIAAVLDAVIRSALRRQPLPTTSRNGRTATKNGATERRLRVGLVHNLKRIKPGDNGENDHEAEFDTPTTVAALGDAIASLGHDVVPIEATPELLARLSAAHVDAVFNIAEGMKGRSREAIVPALLELLDVPYTGSDPSCLAIAHDKGLAKRVARQAGVPTADFFVLHTGNEALPRDFRFPAVVKPLAEGSSKGVVDASVVHGEADARRVAKLIIERYDQAALLETFLPGREFTIGVLGERRPRVLPPMEIVFSGSNTKTPIYTFAHKLDFSKDVRYQCPAEVSPGLGAELARVARTVFLAFGCRDVARIDVRLDAAGRVNFIECNPLPGMTPDFSDLCLIAKAAGMDYRTLVGEILAPALRRRRTRGRSHPGVHAV